MSSKRILSFLYLALFGWSLTFAQTTASEYYDLALKAYKEKKYEAFVENLQNAIQAGTRHPRVFYNMACGYALLHNQSEAIRWLNRIADLGISYPIDKDSDFDSIRKSPEFQDVIARFGQNRHPVIRSTPAFTIEETDFIPEGIAFDPSGKTFYLGSILKRKIVMLDPASVPRNLSSPEDGLWSVLGMSVDPKTNSLWVSSSTLEGLEQDGAKSKSAIFRYDLRAKKLAKKYALPEDQPHQLGDVIVNRAGDAFTTDSLNPAVYRIDHRTDRVEQLPLGDLFRSPQGLCFSADERFAFLADYVRGVFCIDLQTNKSWNINAPANVTLAGIDGLYRSGDALIATQNGFIPNRILRIQLNRDNTQTQDVQVLEASDPAGGEITLAALAGDDFYFVANSQLGIYLKDKAAKLAPTNIRKLNLTNLTATK